MYRAFTADEWRKHLKLPADYTVDGFLIYGTFKKYPYDVLRSSAKRLRLDTTFKTVNDEFLEPIHQFQVNGKTYWFVVAYGGALLSEYLHLACMFGSRKNILLGSCGGLKKGAKELELIVPDWSYAEESSAKSYQPDTLHKYAADKNLSDALAATLSAKHTVYRGATVTHQAMMGETWDDVMQWSEAGYIGVEMEAATVFAVSKHFDVPAAAILRIGDNLIEEVTVVDNAYETTRHLRRQISEETFDVALAELLAR